MKYQSFLSGGGGKIKQLNTYFFRSGFNPLKR